MSFKLTIRQTLPKDKKDREHVATMTKKEIVEWAFELSNENDRLNAAPDKQISDTTGWGITDPRVQEAKQDLLNQVKEEEE